MINFTKDERTGVIKIIKNEKSLYTVAEKTYKCLNKMGMGHEHIIEMVEQLHEVILPSDEKENIREYFMKIEEETKAFIKAK
jgi:hypothetical protein